MIKAGVETVTRKNLKYIVAEGKEQKEKPWLGDLLSFAYDFLMDRFVFPVQLGSDGVRHLEIMTRALGEVKGKKVLELASGSGSAVNFLNRGNNYIGTDISPGLLKRAVRKFPRAGFKDAEFYVTGVADLPFEDNIFDVVLCILALNFFEDFEQVLMEIRRVLNQKGEVYCCVPVSDRMKAGKSIEGTLYSESELEAIFTAQGFGFEALPDQNGAIFYFKAALGA